MLKHLSCMPLLCLAFLYTQESSVVDYKKLDWKLGIEYVMNSHNFRSDSIKHHSSPYNNLFLKVGIVYRPIYRFGMEFYTGIGMQRMYFKTRKDEPRLSQEDLNKLQNMISDPQLIADIQNAIQTGNFGAIPDGFDWSLLNYDYLRSPSPYGVSSYVVPFDLRFSYFFDDKTRIYLGANYNKGGLIDDASIFLGATIRYIDVRFGYVAYFSNQTHTNARIEYANGAPITISVGVNW